METVVVRRSHGGTWCNVRRGEEESECEREESWQHPHGNWLLASGCARRDECMVEVAV